MKQRSQKRVAAGGQISLLVDGVRSREFLYNLSPDGCMVETRGTMAALGSRIALDFAPGKSQTGRVVWVSAEAMGVRFDRPIAPATLDYFRLTDWRAPEAAAE